VASSVQAFTYARVVSTDFHWVLAGADHVVLPAAISVLRVVHMITHPAGGDGQQNLNEQLAQIDVQIDELAIPQARP